MSTWRNRLIRARHSSRTSASRRKAGTRRLMLQSMDTGRSSSVTIKGWRRITSLLTLSGMTRAPARRRFLRLPCPAPRQRLESDSSISSALLLRCVIASIVSRRKWSRRNLKHLFCQAQQGFTQFWRVMNDERQVQRHQIARLTFYVIILILKQDSCWRGRKRSIECRNLLLNGIQCCLKLHFNVPAGFFPGILLHHVGPAIKPLWSFKGFLKPLYLLDAVQAKCTVVLTQAAVPNQVPVPVPSHHAIRLNLAMRHLVEMGTIVHGNALLLSNRFAKIDHEGDIRSCLLSRRKKEQVRSHGVQAFPCAHGKHAGDFCERSFDGHRRLSDLQPRGSQQAKHDRCGFLFRQHERWQFKARTEPVPTVPADVGLDRNTDILEMCDVAAHRTHIHFQASGSLWPADE